MTFQTMEQRRVAPWWFIISMILALIWTNMILFVYWANDPFGKFAFLGFIVWLLGFKWIAINFTLPRRSMRWWVLVVVLVFLGVVCNLQILDQAALAAAVAGRFETRLARICCYAAALGWTPVFGWGGEKFLSMNLDIYRIPWILIFLLMTYANQRRTRGSTLTTPP